MRNKLGQFVKGYCPPTAWKKGCPAPPTAFKKGCISWCKGGKNPKISGEKHPQWKGKNAKYYAIHLWITHRKGKPHICKFCGTTSKKRRINWMNIDHKYSRNLKDYLSACCSCHRNHDLKYNLKPNNKIGTNQFKEHNYTHK